MTVFLQKGYRGMNFTVIDGVEHYHKTTDDYTRLNKNSAYHYLITAKGLAGLVANMDLTLLDSNDDGLYFPFFPSNAVIMTVTAARVIAGLLLILSVLWIVWTLKRGKNNVPAPVRFLRHAIWYPLIMIAVAVVAAPSLLGIFGVSVFALFTSAVCYEATSVCKYGLVIRTVLYAILGFALLLVCVLVIALLYLALSLVSLPAVIAFGILPLSFLTFAGLGIRFKTDPANNTLPE